MSKPETMNKMGENKQIRIFSEQKELPEGYLCFSRFRGAANCLIGRYEMWIGFGDKQNEIEDALALAYAKGWKDAASE